MSKLFIIITIIIIILSQLLMPLPILPRSDYPLRPILQALAVSNSAFFMEGKHSVGLFFLGVPKFQIYCELCLALLPREFENTNKSVFTSRPLRTRSVHSGKAFTIPLCGPPKVGLGGNRVQRSGDNSEVFVLPHNSEACDSACAPSKMTVGCRVNL